MASNETTPLILSEPERSYMYTSARNRSYRSKVRKFQCCVCAGLLGAFVVALVVTISYMVNHDVDDATNTTNVSPVNDLQSLLSKTWPVPDSKTSMPHVLWATEDINGAVEAGKKALEEQDKMEIDHPSVPLAPSHPTLLYRRATFSSAESGRAARVGTILLTATKSISKNNNGKWSGGRSPQLPPSDWMSPKWCPAADYVPDCLPSPYRSMDGSCNNLENPEYGLAMRPFRRALAAAYDDGISSPRRAKDGSELPNARQVSQTVHRPLYRNDPKFTVMLAVWGQFVDHDFTSTALSQRNDGSAITCCNTDWQHPECYPVNILPEDPFYAQYNVTCIDFVRSASAPTCSLGPREQLNQVTPFIDGSVVYGGSQEMANDLRTFKGGLLKSSRSADGRELLPVDTSQDSCNQAEEIARGRYCFKSGDARANENLHLTTLHLILARQHNQLATKLAFLNPGWNDERLYEESRRIVAAQIQYITFNEFLPIIIGQELSDKLELTPQRSGYYHGYNSSIDVQVTNEFVASAFRFGHTLLQGLLKMIANDTSSPDYIEMHKLLFYPFGLYEPGYMKSTVRGALHTDIQRADTYFSEEVSQKLFQPKAGPCGLDLVSLNVQRGRDHGLQPYVAWREHFGLSRPRSFEDLKEIMDSDTVTRLATMYKSVDDIDVYTGIVSENPIEAAGLLGPTATSIIADQFVRFKRGDRYWFETPEGPQAFTPEQLTEIRKTTLSTLLCDNTDSLEEVQPFSMRAITPENPITKCADIARPDLSSWVEKNRVLLFGAFHDIKPHRKVVPTAEEHYHIFNKDPTNHKIVALQDSKNQKLIIGASVILGNITGSYGAGNLVTIWDGNLPAAIPYPFFDNMKHGALPFTVPTSNPVEYRGGFLWGGQIYITSTGTLRLSANYHLPITPLGVGDKSVREWWCGEAELEFKVNWNSSEMYDIPENNYFTPAMFQKIKGNANQLISPTIDETFVGRLQSRVDRDPLDPSTLPRIPLILLGQYSADNSIFWWNGNVTFIFPPKSELASPKLLTAFEHSSSIVAFGGTITTGKITIDENTETVWDGTLPLDITIASFDVTKDIWHGGNTLITGSLTPLTSETYKFTGMFSIPVSDSVLSGMVAWKSGIIDTTLQVAWNNSVVSALKETNAFCYIYLKDSTKLSTSTLDPETMLLVTPGAPTIFTKVLLILDGQFTNANTFRWFGNLTVFIKFISPKSTTSAKEIPQLQISYGDKKKWPTTWKKLNKKNLIVGATVTSGTITGSYSLDDLETVWDGAFPAAIPFPYLYKIKPNDEVLPNIPTPNTVEYRGGALWGGYVEITSSGTLKLSANYHLPLNYHNANNSEPKWWCGEAELEMKINWNSSELHGQSQGDFFSPIAFRKVSSDQKENAFMNIFAPETGVNLLQATTDRAPLDPNIIPHFPIILHGQYTKNNSVFWWNGKVTLVFPKQNPKLILKTFNSKLASQQLAFSGILTTGSVVSSAGLKWWSGTLPQNIFVPNNDKSNNLFHGGSVVLSGSFVTASESTINFKGGFSFPNNNSTHGNIFWSSGKIESTISLQWKSNNLASLPQSSTTMYAMIFMHEFNTVSKMSDKIPSELTTDVLLSMAPGEPRELYPILFIILQGHFTAPEVFTWSGRLTVIIKSPEININPVTPSLFKAPHSQRRLVLGGKVQSGKITGYSGSVPKKLWFDGNFPVSISMPAFDRYLPWNQPVLGPESTEPIFHGHGVMWTGSITPRPGTRQIEIYGDFQLPLYIHSSTFTQQWFLGHVELLVDVVWNSTSLDASSIKSMPDVFLYSPIRFRADEPMNYTLSEAFARLKASDPDMMLSTPVLINSPNYHKGPMPRLPIILHGYMSSDRSAFIWSGNVTIVFPNQF